MMDNISLTPQDIFEKEFRIDARGYELKDVDKFLDIISKDYIEFLRIINKLENEKKELIDENIACKKELRNLKANIDIVKKNEKEITNIDIIRRLSQLEKYIYGKEDRD